MLEFDDKNMHQRESPPNPSQDVNIVSELERLSAASVRMINTRAWTPDDPSTAEIFAHISPSFRGFFPNKKQQELRLEELVDIIQGQSETYPLYVRRALLSIEWLS